MTESTLREDVSWTTSCQKTLVTTNKSILCEFVFSFTICIVVNLNSKDSRKPEFKHHGRINSRTGDHLIFVLVYKLGLVLSANKLLRNREYLNWWWFHHLDCSQNGGIYKDIICCWNQTLQHAAKEPQYTSSETLKNNLNKKRRNL